MAGTVTAHHGHTGQYDNTKIYVIEGRLERVTMTLPHLELVITVSGDSSASADYPNLQALGIDDAQSKIEPIAPGTYTLQFAHGSHFISNLGGGLVAVDQVTVLALRNCLEPNQLRSQWIRSEDRGVVTSQGRAQTEVEGCA